VLARLLPPAAVAVEAFGDRPGAQLFPAEEAAVAAAVAKRRREFATGRACAREALARLGVPAAAIVPGPGREPGWPDGVVGSITHCDGYRACAVARRADLAAIGVDAEPDGPLPGGVLERVASAAEQAHLAGLAAAAPGGPSFGRLLFSAKESVYKAWYPLTGRWLGFADAAITISAGDGAAGTFAAEFTVPGPVLDGRALPGFGGRWLAAGGLVVTAIAVPAG
jgi:4'-phosphopantetheinyl transferase EntD